MVWDDLTAEEKAFFSYFRNEECGICLGGTCPIITSQTQKLHLDQPGPYFRPEVLGGNPKNPIWYLATNPGLRGVNDALHGCLRTADGCSDEQFGNHELQWFDVEDVQRYNDPVTKASLVTNLAFHNQPLDNNSVHPTNEDIANHHAELANVCIMNIAHCKSRNWRYSGEQENLVWDSCGRKTLEILAHWRPGAIVAFGWTPLKWLGHVHGTNAGAYENWHLDENGLNMVALLERGRPLPIGRVATLTRVLNGQEDSLHFVSAQRFGSWWTQPGVQAVVDSLHALLD